MCAKQHASALVSMGWSSNTADCDFLPDSYTVCFHPGLLLEVEGDLFSDPTMTTSITATTTTPTTTTTATATCRLVDCGPGGCCSGYSCQWHHNWGKNVCQLNEACSMKHDDCNWDSDCCSSTDDHQCIYHPGFGKNVCQDPAETVCLEPLNDCSTSNDSCCSGYTCQWHNNWNKNVCQIANSNCSMKHEDCNSSADCCSNMPETTCRYLDWLGRNACQDPY